MAVNENDAIALMRDKSGNAHDAVKNTVSARPLVKYLPTSRRPYLSFDGVDDVLTTVTPNLGSNCTIVRFFAGSVTILTGQTIGAGTWNQTTSNFGGLVINRALTAVETAAITAWGTERSGNADQINVQYGADAANELLDVYHSSGHPNRPIIVMVHGGGWRNGDKLLDNVVLHKGQHWIPRGITFVSVNYKLDVGTSPLDQAQSVAKAIAYVQAHAAGWGCNPNNLIWMGHSAGAHLSNLAQSDRSIRAAQGVQPWLGSLLLDSAAYNVVSIMSVPHLPLYDEPWGTDPAVWAAGSPTLVLDARVPPFMCVVSQTGGPHGESDAENTQEYIDKATSFGSVATRRDTALGHGELNNLLGTTPAVGDTVTDATYTADVDAWLATLGI